jgi:hypothetical protein
LLPCERVKLAGSHPFVDGDEQEGREGGWRQLVGELHETSDVRLPRRLRVAAPTACAKSELGERVAVYESSGGCACGVVEKRAERRDGAEVAAAFEPRRDVFVTDGA